MTSWFLFMWLANFAVLLMLRYVFVVADFGRAIGGTKSLVSPRIIEGSLL